MTLESLDKMEKTPRRPPFALFAVFLILFIGLGYLLVVLNERDAPTVALTPELKRIGLTQEIGLSIHDLGRGVRSVAVAVRQDGKEVPLYHKEFPRQGFFGAVGPTRFEHKLTVHGKDLGLRDGVVELVVVVRDYSWWGWMRGNITREKFAVVLDTRPPQVNILESPRYIRSGSCGVVVYRLTEPAEEHGVVLNGVTHKGFALPRLGQDVFGALVGVPHDIARIEQCFVFAKDRAGNLGRSPFGMILRKAPKLHDRINISDSFLARKLPEFSLHYPELSGSALDQFLYINREIRRRNYEKVQEICRHSVGERLWDGPFKRLPRSSRRANFAEYRTYYYQGKVVDEEVHLGVDLASVRHAEVTAGNRGKVVFADYLGIYGNTVILDHGQGLFSLYSHMSRIDVAVGDMVERGAVLGLTGTSGMAGGDHLHFSVLVNGVFVNPVEWWDKNWLANNILSVL